MTIHTQNEERTTGGEQASRDRKNELKRDAKHNNKGNARR